MTPTLFLLGAALIGTAIAAPPDPDRRQARRNQPSRDVDLSIPDQSDYGWGRESSNQDRDG